MKVLALACMVLSAFLPEQATPQAPAAAPDFAGSWVVDQAKTAQVSGTPSRPHGVQLIYKITQTATTITMEARDIGMPPMNIDKAGKLESRIVWRLDGEPSKNQPGVGLTSASTLQTHVTTWKDGKLTNTVTWHDERGDQIRTDTWWREGPWLATSQSWIYYNGTLVRTTLYFKRA